ncbi:MAG: hypothetical protein ACI9IJ_001937 [Psychromonas sp.]
MKVIGMPLYLRAEAIIPLRAALVAKGMALGIVIAMIIGSAGASFTEIILLKSIFKNQIIAEFSTVMLSIAVAADYLYSFIFGSLLCNQCATVFFSNNPITNYTFILNNWWSSINTYTVLYNPTTRLLIFTT